MWAIIAKILTADDETVVRLEAPCERKLHNHARSWLNVYGSGWIPLTGNKMIAV